MSNTAEVLEAPVLRVVRDDVDIPAWIEYLQKEQSDGVVDLDIIVCEIFKVDPEILFTSNRVKEVKNARFAYMYTMVKVFKYSYSAVMRMTGWEHTSVMHACKTAKTFMETEPDYDMKIRRVLARVCSSMVRVPTDPKVNPSGYRLVFRGEQFINSTAICSQEKNS